MAIEHTPVPYNPALEVGPNLPATPYVHEETPLAAFGGLVAQAYSGLGATTETAGKEIFERGRALQQMHQESAALEATAHYSNALGDLEVQLHSKMGKDAADYFPTFKQQVNDSRDQIRSGLSSPYARFVFDQESRNQQAWVMRSAGAHVGEQERVYSVGAYEGRRQSIIHSMAINPSDPTVLEQGIAALEDLNKNDTANLGKSQEAIDYKTKEDVSKAIYSRLRALGATEPHKADQLREQYAKDGRLFDDDNASLQSSLSGHLNTIGARNTVDGILAGDGNRIGDAKLSSNLALAGLKAVEGGNYAFVGKDYTNKEGQTGHPLGAYSVMSYNLSAFLKDVGMPDMTEQAFLTDHDAQDQLARLKMGKMQDQYGSYNAALDHWLGLGARDPEGMTHDRYKAIANAAVAHAMPDTDKIALARQRASEQSTDPNHPDYAEARMVSQINLEERKQRQAERERQVTIDKVLGGDFTNGRIPDTIEEAIHASPDFANVYNSSDHPGQVDIQQQLDNAHLAQTKLTSPIIERQLLSLAHSDSPADVQKFLDTKLYSVEGLGLSAINSLKREQDKLWKDRGANASTAQMLEVVQPILNKAGLYRANKQDYDAFRGEFVQMVNSWKEQHPDKPLEIQTYQDIASGLAAKTVDRTSWWGSEEYNFQIPLQPGFIKDMSAKVGHDIMANPHEAEFWRQEWIRHQLNEIQKQKGVGDLYTRGGDNVGSR